MAPTDRVRPLPTHLRKLIDLLPLNEPVHQSVLFQAYGRSNYARRVRKIVSEYGWDIERQRGKKGANDDYYIRRSDGPVRPQHIRYEVPPAMRRIVYRRDKWTCLLCRSDVSENQFLTKPQCDHKVPAERGGQSVPENLQTLCTTCNLKKRQSCKHCHLPDCSNCEFAFPERLAGVVVVRLGPADADRLDAVVGELGCTRSEAVLALIRRQT